MGIRYSVQPWFSECVHLFDWRMEAAPAPPHAMQARDPAVLYPPTLLTTQRLSDLFDPARTSYPWHRLPPPQQQQQLPSPQSQQQVPTAAWSVSTVVASGSTGGARPVYSAPPQPRSMQSLSGSTPPLSAEHTKRIFEFVRARDVQRATEQRKTGWFERVGMALGTTTASTVTFAWLREHDVTLEDLIVICNIPVTDLYQAHIVRTVEDLQQLGFAMPMLTANRMCLNVQQMSMCFHIHSAHPLVTSMNLSILFEAANRYQPFTADELLTLGVTADSLLADMSHDADPRALGLCGLSASDWLALGLDAERIRTIRLTASQCRSLGDGWRPDLVARQWELGDAWLAKR